MKSAIKPTSLALAAILPLAFGYVRAAEPAASAASPTKVTPAPAAAPPVFSVETKKQRDARMAWWRDARFGMFIHWGVYAQLAGIYEGKQVTHPLGEQIMFHGKIPIAKYKEIAKEFNPTQYNAEEWVLLAKRAGMKYIVITTKHIDGFALWPSAVNDWDVESTPSKKDLLQPLAEACRKHGMKLGFYYSQIWDMANGGTNNHHDPANKRDLDDYLTNHAVPQIRELLTQYGEFPDILWWDVPDSGMNRERAAKFLEVLKLKPNIIQNNRLYKMHGAYGVIDMKNLETNARDPYFGDTETPEQFIPPTGLGKRDFEVCMTMNDSWGYKKDDHNWKSNEVLLHQLIDVVSKGGNYLLNVGPTGEGLIPQPSVERLEAIGKWMTVNHESIYGTTASPFNQLVWGRCTKMKHEGGTTLYLHVFDWPKDGKLLVPGLKNSVTSASLLATGGELTSERKGSDVVVKVPAEAPDAIATVIKLEIQGAPDIVQLEAPKDPKAIAK
jgi:alpha-L-fucosidase